MQDFDSKIGPEGICCNIFPVTCSDLDPILDADEFFISYLYMNTITSPVFCFLSYAASGEA